MLLCSPADKKRRRDEELGLKQWMENLGKPDPPEDLQLHDDSLLFSIPGPQDFSPPASYGMPCGMGRAQGSLAGFDALASEDGLVHASSRGEQLVLPAWEMLPADNGNILESEVKHWLTRVWSLPC